MTRTILPCGMLSKKDVLRIDGVHPVQHHEVIEDMFSDSSEEWRHAANHHLAKGRLLVSSMGRIARLPFIRTSGIASSFRIVAGTAQYRGHLEVSWSVEWNKRDARGTPKRARAFVHQLVARTFLGPPSHQQKRAVVRHKNGNPADNRVINLVWGSDLHNHHDKLSEPGKATTAPHGLWIGPALHRRILSAIRGDLDPVEVLIDLDARIKTVISCRTDA